MRLALYSHKVMTCFSRLSAAAPWRAKWVLNKQEKVIMATCGVFQSALTRISVQKSCSSQSCRWELGYHFVSHRVWMLLWFTGKSAIAVGKKGCFQGPNPSGQLVYFKRTNYYSYAQELLKLRKTDNTKCQWGWEQTEISHTVGGSINWYKLWKTIWQYLQKLTPLTQ